MSLVFNKDGTRKIGERGPIYRAEAKGVAAESRSPEFPLARSLIEAGHDPDQPFITEWDDGRESMTFTSLGVAAKLTIGEGARGLAFRPFKEYSDY